MLDYVRDPTHVTTMVGVGRNVVFRDLSNLGVFFFFIFFSFFATRPGKRLTTFACIMLYM